MPLPRAGHQRAGRLRTQPHYRPWLVPVRAVPARIALTRTLGAADKLASTAFAPVKKLLQGLVTGCKMFVLHGCLNCYRLRAPNNITSASRHAWPERDLLNAVISRRADVELRKPLRVPPRRGASTNGRRSLLAIQRVQQSYKARRYRCAPASARNFATKRRTKNGEDKGFQRLSR